LERVASNAAWPFAPTSELILGCPGGFVDPPPAIVGSWKEVVGPYGPPRVPEFRIRLYVLDALQSELLGPYPYSRAAYDMVCVELVCAEVSTAIFIPRDAVEDASRLEKILAENLGVSPYASLHERYPDGHP
jgi:hypothetical protein